MVVPHTHRYHPPKCWPNPKHHDGAVIFPHFALHACACSLLLDFGVAKVACNGLKMGSFHLFVHPKWSQYHSWKNIFLILF